MRGRALQSALVEPLHVVRIVRVDLLGCTGENERVRVERKMRRRIIRYFGGIAEEDGARFPSDSVPKGLTSSQWMSAAHWMQCSGMLARGQAQHKKKKKEKEKRWRRSNKTKGFVPRSGGDSAHGVGLLRREGVEGALKARGDARNNHARLSPESCASEARMDREMHADRQKCTAEIDR